MKKSLIIVGGGGQCKVILDCLVPENYDEVFIEDPYVKSSTLYGLTVIQAKDNFDCQNTEYVVAIGDNFLRSQIVTRLRAQLPGVKFATIIHPNAYVAETASLGSGTVVCAGSIIGAYAKVGHHVIINTSCSVDHDTRLENYCSIGPNATLGGNVSIGERSVVAISATISHGISVTDSVIIGACSLVLSDINENLSIWMGVPALRKRKRRIDETYL